MVTSTSASESPQGKTPARPYLTYLILAICWGIFFHTSLQIGSLSWQNLLSSPLLALQAAQGGALTPQGIHQKEYWRFLTAIFYHLSLVHIVANSIALYTLGSLLEPLYGHRNFGALFLFCGSLSSLLAYPWEGSQVFVSAGASGAIFGLLGAAISLLIRYKSHLDPQIRNSLLGQLLFWCALGLGIGLFLEGVGNITHGMGLLTGLALGFYLTPRHWMETSKRGESWLIYGGGTLLLLLLASPSAPIPSSWIPSQPHFTTYSTPYFTLQLPQHWQNKIKIHKEDNFWNLRIAVGPIVDIRVLPSTPQQDVDGFIEMFWTLRKERQGRNFYKIPRQDRMFHTTEGKEILGKKFGLGWQREDGRWIEEEVEVVQIQDHLLIFRYSRLQQDGLAKKYVKKMQSSLRLISKIPKKL